MPEYEQIAALIVFPLALTGFAANWTVAVLIRKLPTLKNSFGYLTSSQSTGDAIHSTFFAFYFVPMCLFNIKELKTYSSVCGHILLIAYDISTYSHLWISLNRFCSIMFPTHYERIFSMKHTKILILFSWTLAIFPSFYLYSYHDCKFYFINDFWAFVFSTTEVCQTIVWYADFLKYNSIVLLIVIIDIVTISKVRNFNKKLSKTLSPASLATRKNREMNFLKQACLQALVFVLELITYFLITPKVPGTERWLRFFLSTVAWVCVHMLDGLITLNFNKEFSQFIFHGCKIQDVSSTTHQNKVSVTNNSTKPQTRMMF